MSEQTTTVVEMPAETFFAGIGESVGRAVGEAFKANGVGQPQGGPAVLPGAAAAPAREEKTPEQIREERLVEIGAVIDPRERLYDRMPAELRKYRNPGSDEEMKRWIRAAAQMGRQAGASDVLVEWDKRTTDAYERASTLAGTTTATSGLSGGTAGPLIPLPLANAILALRDRSAVLRPYCRTWTSDALTLRPPVVGVATAYMVDENATTTQGEPTYTSVLMSKKKMKVYWRASQEAFDYSAFDLVSLFAERSGAAFGRAEDTGIVTSNGTAPNFSGSLETPNANSAGAQTVTTFAEATSTVLVWEDLVKMFLALPQEWRADAVWMGGSVVTQLVSTVPDDSGRQVFAGLNQTGTPITNTPGQLGTLLGRPYLEVPSLSAGNLFFGFMGAYYLLEGGMTPMQMTDQVGWANDLLDFKITSKIDGAIASTTPFRLCAGLATVA